MHKKDLNITTRTSKFFEKEPIKYFNLRVQDEKIVAHENS